MIGVKLTQPLRRNAELFPDRIATVAGEVRTSWGSTLDRVSRLATGFRNLGVGPADRIAVLSLNSDSYIQALYAILWAGCVAVPLNTRWSPKELEAAIEDCAPSVLLFDDHSAAVADGLKMAGVRLVAMESGCELAVSMEELIASGEPREDASGGGSDLAVIFYTGGTTGQSKGVMLSHANLFDNFMVQQALIRYGSGSTFLHVAPMFHLADACCLFGMTMLGATHVILPAFEAKAALRIIEAEAVTATLAVPTMIEMLVEESERSGRPIAEVRNITYGASPISEASLLRALAAMPNARFAQAYGQTECSPVVTILEHEDHRAGLLRSAGVPIPGVDLRIVDDEYRDVPRGSVGQVLVSGPNVMLGYWRQPGLSESTVVDGWLRTGDAGYRDERGFLYLVDRVKDMIISGGENIYSAEVENALMSHPAVLQCAVIGVPDVRWGEAVHAFVRLRNDATTTADDLRVHGRSLIANYKCPKSFTLLSEPLPMSGVGKILKDELRRRWAAENAAGAAPSSGRGGAPRRS